MNAINVGSFSHFNQASLLDISSCVTWPSHVLYFAEQQFAEHA